MKMAIKLLGVSRKSQDGSLSVRTAPFLVREDHPLHSVQGVFNGVFVHGNMVDDLMFYGRGAGKFPTASAVVSDVMECAKNIGRNISFNWSDEIMALSDKAEDSYRYFVRVDDSEAAVAAYTFKAANNVSFEGAPDGETAFVTANMTEKEFAEIAKSFKTIKQCIRLLQD
jgi:homoserine dehydrogenase